MLTSIAVEWLKQAASMGLIAGLPVLAACEVQAQGSRLAGVKANPLYAPADEKSTRSRISQLLQLLRVRRDKTDPPVMTQRR